MPKIYRFIEDTIHVGMRSEFSREGNDKTNYYWELTSNPGGSFKSSRFKEYIKVLRSFFVGPSQILNTGTFMSESDPLDEQKYLELQKGLSRPYMLFSVSKEDDKVDYVFIIDSRGANKETISINKLPRFLIENELTLEDVAFDDSFIKRRDLSGMIRKKVLDYR